MKEKSRCSEFGVGGVGVFENKKADVQNLVWVVWVFFAAPIAYPQDTHTTNLDLAFIYSNTPTTPTTHSYIEGTLEVERGGNGLEAKHSIEFGVGGVGVLGCRFTNRRPISRNSTPILEYPYAR